jgi:hypothetical protein
MSTLSVIEVPKCEGCHLLSEKFEDTKGIIVSRKSKDRQHNGQKKKDKRTNHDLQNITYKTKDRVTRTPLKTEGEFRWSGRVVVHAPLVTLLLKPCDNS